MLYAFSFPTKPDKVPAIQLETGLRYRVLSNDLGATVGSSRRTFLFFAVLEDVGILAGE
jgi:hypothetical protein